MAVITVWNSRFTLDYANSKSVAYLNLKEEIIAEVQYILGFKSGLGVIFIRFILKRRDNLVVVGWNGKDKAGTQAKVVHTA